MKRVIVIDALNAYFRAYIVNPSLSSNGQPIGGYKGFLGILQKLAREMNPDEIVIAWDGAGGSARRKTVNKNYKAGRKPIRLNRGVRNMTEDEEMKNKVWQQYRLIEMLNCTPAIQLMLDGTEADDIIAYVTQSARYDGWQKIIISSDRDFFQLCDEETVLYRPIQKTYVNKPRLIEEYGIHPTNFALARAVAGDKSDNLPGVKGVGLATLAKRMPFFANEESVTLTQLVDFCENNNTGLKKLEAIAEAKDLVAENYKIMQLYAPSISIDGKNKIKYIFENYEPLFNKTEIIKRMNEDGFGGMDLSDLFAIFKRFTTNA
jgi:5'-3' exonuclease